MGKHNAMLEILLQKSQRTSFRVGVPALPASFSCLAGFRETIRDENKATSVGGSKPIRNWVHVGKVNKHTCASEEQQVRQIHIIPSLLPNTTKFNHVILY
jgi:hypothetical protein